MNLAYQSAAAYSLPAVSPAQVERWLLDLLIVLQRSVRERNYGLADRESCRRELGLIDEELELVLRAARQRGFIDAQAAYGRLGITRRGLERVERLWR